VARGGRVLSEAEADAVNLVPDDLRGLDRFAARKAVVDQITAEGLAVMTRADDPRLGKGGLKTHPTDGEPPASVPLVEARTIMQPFGDRSKVVIEPMLTDQWFVDTARIVEPALEAVRSGATKIIPEAGEKTYFHWLENIEPWCISRQLWWGHQIPVWYGPKRLQDETWVFNFSDPERHTRICASSFAEAQQWAVKHFSCPVSEASPKVSAMRRCDFAVTADGRHLEDVRLIRDPDVLDTWFSSGLWPIGTLGWPEPTEEMRRYFPTSVLVTGFDIIFFWVARMMMMQLAVVDQVPFHTVYLHGLVRDAKGKKMSKSLGNVVDPLDAIDEYGADALRFANAAMASLGGVLKYDPQRIAGYRNFGTKLWNACRFAEMNGVWEGHRFHADPPKATATANRWIIGETGRIRAEVDAALEGYRFDQAANALYAFVWGRVCDWYVEFAKPLFDGPETGETRAVMGWVLDQCLILLHPFMPFVTEELWQTTRADAGLLCHAPWPTHGADLVDPAAEREMRWTTGLIEAIRSVRAEVHVPVGLKLDLVAVDWDAAARAAWARNEALIRRLARVEALTEGPAPKGSVAIPVEGATFAIPLSGVIDVAAETARLSKVLEKAEKDLAAIRTRLANPQFLASAKEEVVDEAKARVETLEAEAAQIGAALGRLRAMG
jgi:valyl-tRNA synthetase